MKDQNPPQRLKLLPHDQYKGIPSEDPVRFYHWPIIGNLYRRRVELCLAECRGGERILEVGFGSGTTFLNLHELYDEIHGLDLTAAVEEVKTVFEVRNIPTFLQNGNVLDMPYSDNYFDTVLLISILEHLHPNTLERAFHEIQRVLRPGGQVVYGVPVERPLMVTMFRLLGYDIRKAHFSTERQVYEAASRFLKPVRIITMKCTPPIFGVVYEIGHFFKTQ